MGPSKCVFVRQTIYIFIVLAAYVPTILFASPAEITLGSNDILESSISDDLIPPDEDSYLESYQCEMYPEVTNESEIPSLELGHADSVNYSNEQPVVYEANEPFEPQNIQSASSDGVCLSINGVVRVFYSTWTNTTVADRLAYFTFYVPNASDLSFSGFGSFAHLQNRRFGSPQQVGVLDSTGWIRATGRTPIMLSNRRITNSNTRVLIEVPLVPNCAYTQNDFIRISSPSFGSFDILPMGTGSVRGMRPNLRDIWLVNPSSSEYDSWRPLVELYRRAGIRVISVNLASAPHGSFLIPFEGSRFVFVIRTRGVGEEALPANNQEAVNRLMTTPISAGLSVFQTNGQFDAELHRNISYWLSMPFGAPPQLPTGASCRIAIIPEPPITESLWSVPLENLSEAEISTLLEESIAWNNWNDWLQLVRHARLYYPCELATFSEIPQRNILRITRRQTPDVAESTTYLRGTPSVQALWHALGY